MTCPEMTFVKACQELGRMISSRYGDDPGLLETLQLRTVRVPHADGGEGFVLIAYSPREDVSAQNVLSVYYETSVERLRP